MSKSAIDANINNSIFRKDFTQIIALRRDLASLSPIRLKVLLTDYSAGQVLAYNSVGGYYEKFSTASGTYTASAVLFEGVVAADQTSATAGALARGIFAGHLFKDLLIDYDSNSKSQLGAVDYRTADGVNITKF